MGWQDNTFPTADDPNDVGWMIMYWRTVPCNASCKEDYRLESRQFAHLLKAATAKEAEIELAKFAADRRDAGINLHRKNHTLFLCKVHSLAHISDNTGKIIDGG